MSKPITGIGQVERKAFIHIVTYLKRVYMDQNALLLIAIILHYLRNQTRQTVMLTICTTLYFSAPIGN